MAMTFLEANDWAMVVMDGRRCVAKARRYGVGYWLLKLEGASWIDPRARQPIRDDLPAGFSDLFSKYPNMLAVKGKAEARKIMQGLTATGTRPSRTPSKRAVRP